VPRCAVPACTDRVARIVGDCRYCQSRFCSRHRLPEEHDCANMSEVKEASFKRNQDKLMAEKCVAAKV
jgi:predicted nucleic acid binding AN1-type Zn finger protein